MADGGGVDDQQNQILERQRQQQAQVLPTERQPPLQGQITPQSEALQHPEISPEEVLAGGVAGKVAEAAMPAMKAAGRGMANLAADEAGQLRLGRLQQLQKLFGTEVTEPGVPLTKAQHDELHRAYTTFTNANVVAPPDQRRIMQALERAKDSPTKRTTWAEGGQLSKDDVPEASKANAEAVQKGATDSGARPSSGTYWGNLKSGLGLAQGGPIQRFAEGSPDGIQTASSQQSGGETYNSSQMPVPDTAEGIVSDAALNLPNPNQKYIDIYERGKQQLKGGVNPPAGPGFALGKTGEDPNASPLTDPQIEMAAANSAMQAKHQDEAQAESQKAAFNQQAAQAAQLSAMKQSFGLPPDPIPNGLVPTTDTPDGPKPNPQGAQPAFIGPQDKPFDLNEQMTGAYKSWQDAQRQLMSQTPGEAQAKIYHQAAQKAREMQDTFLNQSNHIQGEIANVVDDIKNGHINPNQYLENMSVAGKISTAIGLLVGGLGAGLQHSTNNAAMQYMNNQIDRNIEAQKINLNQKNTLLGALQHKFGNLKDSTNVFKAINAEVFANKINEAAAKQQDPARRAALQQQAAMMTMQYAPLLQQTAMRQTFLAGLNKGHTDVAAAIPYVFTDPKEREGAQKEYAKIQETEAARRAVEESAQHLQGLFMAGLLSPSDAASAKAAFAGPLAKASEGRFNLQESILQIDALLPGKFDTAETLRNKAQRRMRFFDNLRSGTPTLDSMHLAERIPRAMPIQKLQPKVQ